MINNLILPQRARARSLRTKDDVIGLPSILFCCLSYVDATGNLILVAGCSTDSWGAFLKRVLHTWRGCHFDAGPNQDRLHDVGQSERVQRPPSCRGIVQISTSKASFPFSMPTSVVPLMAPTADFCGLWWNPHIRGHHSPLRNYHHHCYHHNSSQGRGDDYCSRYRSLRHCWLPPRPSPRYCTESAPPSEGRNYTRHVPAWVCGPVWTWVCRHKRCEGEEAGHVPRARWGQWFDDGNALDIARIAQRAFNELGWLTARQLWHGAGGLDCGCDE